MSRDLSFKTFVSETGGVNSEDQMGVFSVPSTVLGTFSVYSFNLHKNLTS